MPAIKVSMKLVASKDKSCVEPEITIKLAHQGNRKSHRLAHLVEAVTDVLQQRHVVGKISRDASTVISYRILPMQRMISSAILFIYAWRA